MDRFTVRLPPDLAGRFDAAASACGGRSRLLRRLIEASAADGDPRSGPVLAEPLTGKLTLRLGAADLAAVEAEGLSAEQYNEITRAAQADPDLYQQLTQMITEAEQQGG